jgi:uncharacterized delta-60 repeat protein
MKKLALPGFFSCLFAATALADGIVIVDLGGNTADSGGSVALAADGRSYVSGYSTVPADPNSLTSTSLLAFDGNGQAVAGFGTGGRVDGLPQVAPIATRIDMTPLVGSSQVTTLSVTGTPLAQFTVPNGCAPLCGGFPYANVLLPLANGSVYAAGGFTRGVTLSDRWTLMRIGANGALDLTFANGAGWTSFDAGSFGQEITGIQALAGGGFLAIGFSEVNGSSVLGRFDASGALDATFATNGLLALTSAQPFNKNSNVGVDPAGDILVPGGTNILERRNSDGSPDNAYTPVAVNGATTYQRFFIDSAGRTVVFGTRNNMAYVARLLQNGGLDAAFSGGEVTLQASTAGTPVTTLVTGLVDAADRPVLLMTVASPAGNSDLALARLDTSGVLDAAFGASQPDSDVFPDPFTLSPNTVPFGTLNVASETVTISGINGPTSVVLTATATNSGYSIGCNGTFVTGPGTILAGQTLCVRHDAPVSAGGTASTTINVGGQIASFVTTASATPADTTPDAFAFTDQTNVATGTAITSNAVTISGIAGAAPVSVQLGEYSIGCTAQFRTSNGTITNGQTICVRHASAAGFATAANTTLAIGGVSDVFTSTTLAADTSPDAFSFSSQSNVAKSTPVTSNAVTIGGINAPAPISVTGGEYSIGCNGTFTSQAGTISAAQTVCLRHTSASASNSSTTTSLSVGGVSGSFSSTTKKSSGGGAWSLQELLVLLLLMAGARVMDSQRALRRARAF